MKSEACLECGSRPTNHFSARNSARVDLAIQTFQSRLLSFPIVNKIEDLLEESFLRAWPVISRMGLWLGLISYQDEFAENGDSRTRTIWEEAKRRGIAIRHLYLFGKQTDVLEVRQHNILHLFQCMPLAPTRTAGQADDKSTFITVMREHDIPAPHTYTTTNIRQARKALSELGRVCIKPRIGSNSRHTFPHVTSPEELSIAFQSAQKLSRHIIVQEHLEGNLARATCVGGILVGFLESQSPTVVGDGNLTVSELIDKQNLHKPSEVATVDMTPLHRDYIARRGYTLQSILAEGVHLPLIYWAGYSSGGWNHEHGTTIHPTLRTEIERAARLTGLPVVGFDLIIEDAQKGPHEQRWGIIEANSLPWIDLHLTPLYGEPVNVAKHVWDLWENSLKTTE